jgi:hypothetical protein
MARGAGFMGLGVLRENGFSQLCACRSTWSLAHGIMIEPFPETA